MEFTCRGPPPPERTPHLPPGSYPTSGGQNTRTGARTVFPRTAFASRVGQRVVSGPRRICASARAASSQATARSTVPERREHRSREQGCLAPDGACDHQNEERGEDERLDGVGASPTQPSARGHRRLRATGFGRGRVGCDVLGRHINLSSVAPALLELPEGLVLARRWSGAADRVPESPAYVALPEETQAARSARRARAGTGRAPAVAAERHAGLRLGRPGKARCRRASRLTVRRRRSVGADADPPGGQSAPENDAPPPA